LIQSSNVILGSNAFWIFVTTAFVVFPLTFFREISKLDKFSMLSSVLILLLIIHSLYYLIKDVGDSSGLDPDHELKLFDLDRWPVVISAFSVNCMAYNCHLNFFSCLESLERCTIKRAQMLGGVTIVVAFFLYNGFGLITYLDLKDKLGPGSALEFYNTSETFTKVTIAGVVLVLIISGPIVNWALRRSVNHLIYKDAPATPIRWIAIGAGASLLAAFLASTSDDVILFFDLVGGLLAPMLILLFPAIAYLKLVKDPPIVMKILAYATAAFTVVGAAACTYQAIDQIIAQFKPKANS
jgi:amino acid permease